MSEWSELSNNLAGTVAILATELPPLLSQDSMTLEEAQRFWDILEKVLDQAARLIETMEDQNESEALIHRTQALEDKLFEVQQLLAPRLIQLGGLRGPLRPDE